MMQDDLDTPRYRSSAAARLANMPVNTLRIWERRYAVISPRKSPSGQRLYSTRDVQRLALIKQLVEEGHAISTLATLGQAQLERLASAPLPARVRPQVSVQADTARRVVVGRDFAQRLEAEGLPIPAECAFDDLAAALGAPPAGPTDALMVHVSTLHPEIAQQVLSLADRCSAASVAVVYTFGTSAAVHTLAMAGVRMHRETLNSLDLRGLLRQVPSRTVPAGAGWGRRAPRYSDEVLARIGRRSSVLACECPRHVAELILQLSAFEQYSDACVSRSPSDAALHRYLGDVSSRARALFETALERIAREEGWQHELPATPATHPTPARSSGANS